MALLTERVLTSPGALEPHVREAIAAGRGLPPGLAAYIEKVSLRAHEVTDEDIEALKRAGFTEDQIFEATVSVALGAGLKRLRAGLDALWGV
jgi:alkylhydroperoxidase family enzyme